MTPQQIKDAAPEGATHYSHKYEYIKLSFRHWLIWDGRDFTYFYMPISDYCKIT